MYDAAAAARAALGKSWDEFRTGPARLRREGIAASKGELDSGRVGIAAPIFDRDGAVLGSLSFVLLAQRGRSPARARARSSGS